MHWANQILFDLDKKKLFQLSNPDSTFAWDTTQYPPRYTELIYTASAKGHKSGSYYCADGGLTGAAYLLERGEIEPAPERKQQIFASMAEERRVKRLRGEK